MTSPRRVRYRDKADWIESLIPGKSVLYVGSVEHNEVNSTKHHQLQERLQGTVPALLGLYCSAEQVRAAGDAGLRAVESNGTDLALDTQFQVIVLADVIEHVTNGGDFLRSVRNHLVPDGVALVSTPNPTSFVRILELLAHGVTKANVEHTCWYTGQVLHQVAQRCGLRVDSQICIDDMHRYHRTDDPARVLSPGKKLLTKVVVALNRVACTFFPQLSETYGFVLVADGECA